MFSNTNVSYFLLQSWTSVSSAHVSYLMLDLIKFQLTQITVEFPFDASYFWRENPADVSLLAHHNYITSENPFNMGINDGRVSLRRV